MPALGAEPMEHNIHTGRLWFACLGLGRRRRTGDIQLDAGRKRQVVSAEGLSRLLT
jgi:hypothetical protein